VSLAALLRFLALASIVPAAATPYFIVFWCGFDFWRRHRALTYVMMVGTLVAVGAAAVAFRQQVLTPRVDLPAAVQAVGWAVMAIANLFGFVADRQLGLHVRSFAPFFHASERIVLETRGVYGVVRHPIYAAGLWFQLGAFLASGYLASLLACAVLLLGALWFTRQEEQRLRERLRDPSDYDRYRARVPALLPWPRRWRG